MKEGEAEGGEVTNDPSYPAEEGAIDNNCEEVKKESQFSDFVDEE